MLEAAARGGDVAFVPRSVIRDAVSSGRLRVLAEIDSAHPSVHAVYPDGGSADLARKAVEVPVEHVNASRE